MESQVLPCPDCCGSLEKMAGAGGLRYGCLACHGFAAGVAVLRRTLAPGLEAALWLASETSDAGTAACPWCRHPMRLLAPPVAPAAVAVCRPCEMVWIPEASAVLLPAAPAPATPAGPAAPALPERCPNCGAPFVDTPDGCCRYCHEALVAPQVVVLMPGFG